MTLFLISFFVFAIAVAGLALGVMLGRGPLRGSCGGDSVVRVCGICRAKERR